MDTSQRVRLHDFQTAMSRYLNRMNMYPLLSVLMLWLAISVSGGDRRWRSSS